MKSTWTVIIFIMVVAVFVALITPRVIQVRSLKERSQNLENELRKLTLENQALETELRLLRDDPVYLEKVARQKFNKAKAGEIVYKVVREGDPPKINNT